MLASPPAPYTQGWPGRRPFSVVFGRLAPRNRAFTPPQGVFAPQTGVFVGKHARIHRKPGNDIDPETAISGDHYGSVVKYGYGATYNENTNESG
jgi:hypothetical protein